MIIRGNVLCVNMPRTDYLETDPARASFLVNNPKAALDTAARTADTAARTADAALARSGGTMSGDIAMDSHRVTGLASPSAEADAATKQYVDGRKRTAAATLSAASWTGKEQTVPVPGVTADNTVLVTPAPSSHVAYNEAMVYCCAQESGSLRFACDEVPALDLAVNILIMN